MNGRGRSVQFFLFLERIGVGQTILRLQIEVAGRQQEAGGEEDDMLFHWEFRI